ncbi:hypothetical protein [Spiroplasma endosymbiont of Zeiraphera isertana]|uniref:hypothetical protein n=1 Tax=Spiroplasma endosymbiont of Zeiraphera isertana TaxID=3066313 RepID=UPI00313B2EFA
MLKNNNLLNSNDENKKLKNFLIKTNFKKFYDKFGNEYEINWIKKPIDSLKENWEIEKIKDYFIYVGSQNFIKKENFYHEIITNKSLIKEQLSLEFINIFDDKFKSDQNYFEFLNITTNQIFEKCEMLINNKIDNSQINSENLDYLLKSELYLLNNNNLENYRKLKNEAQKQQKELNKKRIKKINKNTVKKQEKYSFSNLDEYSNKTIDNISSLDKKISLLKIEKDNDENQNNLFSDIKKINKYLTLLKDYAFSEKNELEKSENINLEEIKNEINFNNKIIQKISGINNMLNTINSFDENNCLKTNKFLKEAEIYFKLLNENVIEKLKENNQFFLEKINIYINKNNNDNSISPSTSILQPDYIDKFKEELQIINNIELIEKEQKELNDRKKELEEKMKEVKKDNKIVLLFENNDEIKNTGQISEKMGAIPKGSKITQSDINKINNFNNQKEPTKSPCLT